MVVGTLTLISRHLGEVRAVRHLIHFYLLIFNLVVLNHPHAHLTTQFSISYLPHTKSVFLPELCISIDNSYPSSTFFTKSRTSSTDLARTMAETITQQSVPCPLPRVTIQFCTQCKWMLRAAYVSCSSILPVPRPNIREPVSLFCLVHMHHKHSKPLHEPPSFLLNFPYSMLKNCSPHSEHPSAKSPSSPPQAASSPSTSTTPPSPPPKPHQMPQRWV